MTRKLKRTLLLAWRRWWWAILAGLTFALVIILAACSEPRCPADKPNLTVNETILTQAQAGEGGGVSLTRRQSVTSCEK